MGTRNDKKKRTFNSFDLTIYCLNNNNKNNRCEFKNLFSILLKDKRCGYYIALVFQNMLDFHSCNFLATRN